MTPNYYAVGNTEKAVAVEGHGFLLIPSDALGVLAYNNDEPLANINTQGGRLLLGIVEKTQNTMRMQANVAHADDVPTYVGAIVSRDRQTVYWVNNTKPLP